ncbi:MAG: hypothetical protein IPK58_10675 [Acidobacteria bacterium]|nr:hypothetical protein [Acidobacteriota bacterium]
MVGDSFGYTIVRVFHEKAKHYRFSIGVAGSSGLIDNSADSRSSSRNSTYGIRAGMCLFY